jgi:hypothetical protein
LRASLERNEAKLAEEQKANLELKQLVLKLQVEVDEISSQRDEVLAV